MGLTSLLGLCAGGDTPRRRVVPVAPYSRVMRRTMSRATGCLFCGNEHGRFESEEHVIPLALGNTLKSGLVESELVIPSGEICDKCNGRRLSLRDSALATWPPVSVFRSLAQIANRRGSFVDAVAKTRWSLELEADDPRLFHLRAHASTGPQSGRDDVARALCKIALETRWLDDPVDARSGRWDPVAAAAIGGALPAGLAFGVTRPRDVADIDLRPESEVLVSDHAELRVACRLEVVGLRLHLLLGSEPPLIPSTAWWTLDPLSSSLRGPNSMWGHFSGRATGVSRLRAGGTDPGSANQSELPTHHERIHLYLQPSRAESV